MVWLRGRGGREKKIGKEKEGGEAKGKGVSQR